MVARICPNENREWHKLVDDEMSPSESMELTAHLGSCTSCRQQFESLCADRDWWANSSATLKQIQSETGTLNQNTAQTASNSKPMIVISGLAPSKETGALGDIDNYTIREIIGYGGMGTVLKAWDQRLSRIVAIKILHPHLAASGAARTRFSREAQLVASISHPNVVPIHDVTDSSSHPYLVMGFVPGGSLQDKLDADGPLSLEETLRIALQVAEGLDAAHSHGLVHRDIKPANLLLEAKWNRVLITDFGLARALDDATITASGYLAGTPQFMSPEQTRGERIDHRSDLFSLGSVIYTMLAGRPPFRAENPMALFQKVYSENATPVHEIQEYLPAWVQQLIDLFHAKSPTDRIQTASESVALLRACLQHVQNPTMAQLPAAVHAPRTSRLQTIIQWSIISVSIALLCISITLLLPIRNTSINTPISPDKATLPTISTPLHPSDILPQTTKTEDSIESIIPPVLPQQYNEMPTPSPNETDPLEWNEDIDMELDLILSDLFELSTRPAQ